MRGKQAKKGFWGWENDEWEGDTSRQHRNTHIFHFIVLINGSEYFLELPALDLYAVEFMWIIRAAAGTEEKMLATG